MVRQPSSWLEFLSCIRWRQGLFSSSVVISFIIRSNSLNPFKWLESQGINPPISNPICRHTRIGVMMLTDECRRCPLVHQLFTTKDDTHLFNGVGCSVNHIPDCCSVLDYWIKDTESKENEKNRNDLQKYFFTNQSFTNNGKEVLPLLSNNN